MKSSLSIFARGNLRFGFACFTFFLAVSSAFVLPPCGGFYHARPPENERAGGLSAPALWVREIPRSRCSLGMTILGGSSDVVVELELVWMRAHAHGIHFVLHLVVDPELDDIFGEDVTLEQVLVVGFKRLQRLLERAGQ